MDERPREVASRHRVRVPDLVHDGQPFLSRDAARLGLSRHQLGRLLTRGALRRPLQGVIIDAQVPDDRDTRLRCVRLLLPERAVLWGRTAAWVWGIDAFSPTDRERITPECAVPHHRGRPTHPAVRVVEARLPATAVAERCGVRLTTPPRTAVDLARWSNRPTALAALDAFAHAGLATRDQLRAEVGAAYRHPGVKQARELVQLVEPRTESPGESWTRLRLVDAGFPSPEAQIVVCDQAGRQVWRIDLGYREHRLGLEYDGADYHESLPAQRRDARRRFDLLHRFRWEVYGFDRGAVLGRRPALELFVGGLLGIEPRLPRRW